MKLFLNNKKTKNFTLGFTLIELMVTASIFVVITSVVMVKFSVFNSRILSTNLAYDIALSIREAQSFGVNVRGFDPGGGTRFDLVYGVHFDVASNNSYIFFADVNNNKKFESNEEIKTLNLGGGYTIKRFCGTTSSGNTICSDTAPSFNNIDIMFERPNLDAIIKRHNPPTTFQSAAITVTSPQGIERQVQVYVTGQISVVKDP